MLKVQIFFFEFNLYLEVVLVICLNSLIFVFYKDYVYFWLDKVVDVYGYLGRIDNRQQFLGSFVREMENNEVLQLIQLKLRSCLVRYILFI